MIWEKKLDLWQKNGLISTQQAAGIRAFEKSGTRTWLPLALTGIGALAVVLGIVSLVAHNWHSIPDAIKLGGHIALSGALGLLVAIAAKSGWSLTREIALAVFCTSIMTFIALLGQIYQLQSDLYKPMLTWMVLCSGALLYFGKSKANDLFFIAALVATFFSLGKPLEDLLHWFDYRGFTFAVLWFCLCLYYLFAHLLVCFNKKPFMAQTLAFLVNCSLVILVLGYGNLWHIRTDSYWSFVVALGVTWGALAVLQFFKTGKPGQIKPDFELALLIGSLLFCFVAHLVAIGRFNSWENVVFVILSSVSLAWLAGSFGRKFWFNVGIFIASGRLFVLFFDLIDNSLIETGFGFIVLGVILAGAGVGATRLNKALFGGAKC